MLSHVALGFSGGLLAAGLASDALGGVYDYVYLSGGGVMLLVSLLLFVRDAGRAGRPQRGPELD